ncbi:alpha/beta-hydrolase, partial [Aureobasidium melanogenum]
MRSSFDFLLHLLALSPLAVEPATAARRQSPQEALLLPPIPIDNAPAPSRQHDFTLRHIFHKGSHQYPNLLRKVDVTPATALEHIQDDDDAEYAVTVSPADSYRTNSGPMTIERLADRRRSTIDRLLEAGQMRGEAVSLPASAWSMDEVDGPNITDKQTILSFARMASNAYVLKPHTGD